jgi:hypothetical protein
MQLGGVAADSGPHGVDNERREVEAGRDGLQML